MKKYLQEIIANPEYRKAFEEDEIFATLVATMTYEPQSEVKIVHLLCKHLKDLCEEVEHFKDLCKKLEDTNADVGVFEIDTGAPNKEMLEKRFMEEIHKFKVQYGEPPEVILAGKDIQLLLADYIIVSNRAYRAFKPEKTLFGVPLEDGIEGTIAFASGRCIMPASVQHLCYLPDYVCDKQFEGRQEVMARCNEKDYDIHRKIVEAGKAPPIKRRPKPKMNELFATSPNDNSCRSFHPEANCPYPLCDNMECDERDDCCIHTDYEVKHGPY